MPIVIAPINTELTVVRIALDEKNKKHLLNLGLMEQAKVTVISSSGGNVIIEVKVSVSRLIAIPLPKSLSHNRRSI